MADIVELIFEDHTFFRKHFFYLDDARTVEELRAIWTPLGVRLDTHAEAEERVFYPALLQKGKVGDPEDDTDDAIGDHNHIRDAVRKADTVEVGSDEWWDAVNTARKENGEHLDEEERNAIPDFIKSTTPALRHDLAMAWLRFYYEHPAGEGVDTSDKDPQQYIEQHS